MSDNTTASTSAVKSKSSEKPNFSPWSQAEHFEAPAERAFAYLTWFRNNRRNVTKANLQECETAIGPICFAKMVFILADESLLTGKVLRELVDQVWNRRGPGTNLGLDQWARLWFLAHGHNDVFNKPWTVTT